MWLGVFLGFYQGVKQHTAGLNLYRCDDAGYGRTIKEQNNMQLVRQAMPLSSVSAFIELSVSILGSSKETEGSR